MSDKLDDDEREARRLRIAAANYDVGYGRPPKSTRFQKGNRAAKRRSGRALPADIASMVRRIGHENATITIGGRPVQMKRIELIVQVLMQKAVKGDSKSIQMIIDLQTTAYAQMASMAERRVAKISDAAADAELFTSKLIELIARDNPDNV